MSRDDPLGDRGTGDASERVGANPARDPAGTDGTSARPGGLRARARRLFSPRRFLLALVLAGVGLFVGGLVPLVGSLTRFVGLGAATFALGVASARRCYVEVALAAALAAVGSVLFGLLTSAFLPITVDYLARSGVAFGLVVAGIGALVGVLGYYFGRDLRDGLTRSL
ncbi:hypothetical protein J2752_000857 [Halarchaeum rubridurum]|uniref:Uncharacterized protein n=1 Tax=Halarchaeum rubridurum TaxID=489911 RepID=A0A830FSW9_9EURY|nr:hypothetical protein [Halarchaeum rubridurum]MBP1953976.1 hypothetical protein [Halarchaeum rubridurum]GGM56346.1 hypothetical protein GCM10009017_03150 [Halarchaeum rubridurum]